MGPLQTGTLTTKQKGRKTADRILASFPSCPIPELARLGRALRKWKEAFLAYFDSGATNGGTEAINGLIELLRPLEASRTLRTTACRCSSSAEA